MAAAFVFQVISVSKAATNDDFDIAYSVCFSGSDVPHGSEIRTIQILLTPNDTPNIIETKIATAVTEEATAQGFTIRANGIIFNDYIRRSPTP